MDSQLTKALNDIRDGLDEHLIAKLDAKLAVQQKHLDELTARGKDIRIGGTAPTIVSSIDNALVKNLDNLSRLAKGEIKSFQMDVKTVGDMAFSSNFANASNSVAHVRNGIIENANRPMHVRDLIPKGSMTGSNFVYLKENGAGEGSITAVSEGSTKPQIDFDVTEVVVPAEFIAGWLRITSKMLHDTPSMRTFLSNRLLEALLVVEDTQLMTGSGTSPNLKGINTSGNFTAASGSATIDLEQIVEAIAQLSTSGRNPDGVILHPNDYWRIVLNKAATSGEYDVPEIVKISPTGAVTIAGVPVVWTVAQAEDTYTVGDFAHGSTLLFREDPRIEFFAQDGTNVRENKITIRIEERIAFAVYGSTYFIKGDFGNIA
jgi:HK97 family phage major capsid protein